MTSSHFSYLDATEMSIENLFSRIILKVNGGANVRALLWENQTIQFNLKESPCETQKIKTIRIRAIGGEGKCG